MRRVAGGLLHQKTENDQHECSIHDSLLRGNVDRVAFDRASASCTKIPAGVILFNVRSWKPSGQGERIQAMPAAVSASREPGETRALGRVEIGLQAGIQP